MSEATLFDRIDPVQLAIATERFGFAFATASAGVASSIIVDPRISPEAMVAGICRAHAAGIGSAIATAGRLVDDDPCQLAILQEQLIQASVAYLRELVAGELAIRETVQ